MDLAGELNRLAGIPYNERIGMAGAANLWAGTTGMELVGALNEKAGIPRNARLELNGVLKRLGLATLDQGGFTVSPGAGGDVQLENTLRLPGLSGNYMSTPDTAAISVTGDIDIRVKVAVDSYLPSQSQRLVSKRRLAATASTSFDWFLGTAGLLGFSWSVDGTTVQTVNSAASPSTVFAAGQVGWWRVTFAIATGQAVFYTSSDGASWTQLSAPAAAGATSIFDNAVPLTVGDLSDGTRSLAGHLYYAEVRSGIDGPVVAKFDSASVAVRGDRLPATHTQASAAEAIRLPGVVGNYLSVPDSAANSVTGDLDLRIKVAMDDWTPSAAQTVVAKWAAGAQHSFEFYVDTAGKPTLGWSTTGSDFLSAVSTAATGFTDGSTNWLRVTLDVDNGSSQRVINFYTSADGVTWTPLGSTVTTAGVTSIFDSTATVNLGAETVSTGQMAGLVYEAQVRNGIGGPVVASFNAANTVPTGMRTPATAGDWTINGAAWSWEAPSTAPSAGALRLPGVAGNYVSTPDAADISITGDIDLRARVTLDGWTSATQTQHFVSKRGGAPQNAYRFGMSTGGLPFLTLSTDGTTEVGHTSATAFGYAAGATKWVRATWRASDGRVQFFTSDDGITYAPHGIDGAIAIPSIADTTGPLEVGSNSLGVTATNLMIGYVHRAEVYSGIAGTLVASFDAANVPITTNKLPATVTQSGRVWTVNGALWSWVQVPDPTEWTVAGSNWWWSTNGLSDIRYALQLDEQYVYVPGTNGNYASTPDSAALSINGDMDLRAKVALDSWADGVNFQAIVSKRAPGQDAYQLRIDPDGKMSFLYFVGGANRGQPSTVTTGLNPGQVKWVRATLDVDDGGGNSIITYYLSNDGVTWSQLGATRSNTAGAPDDTTAAVTVGSGDSGLVQLLRGRIYHAEIRNGINGQTVAGVFDIITAGASAVRTPTSWGSATGATWTLNGAGWNWGTYPVALISTPDSAALSITGDLDIRVKVALNNWNIPIQNFVSKLGAADGYRFRMDGVILNRLCLRWHDGTNQRTVSSTADVPFTPGQAGWIRVTLDVDNGSGGHAVTFYTSTDGVTWTILGSAVNAGAFTTSIADGTTPLTIGSATGTQFVMGAIHYAEVRNGIAGTVVGVFNPNVLKFPTGQSPTTVPSPTGETYSISHSGWSWVEV